MPPPVDSTSAANHPLAFRSLRSWPVLVIPAVLGLAADLYIKRYAFPEGVIPWDPRGAGRPPLQGLNAAQHNAPWPVIPNVLGFQTTVNYGAVFGSAQGHSSVFVVFSFLALAAILFVFAKSKADQWVLHLALGLITAGALGNLYDRLAFGCVRDMLRFYVSWYPYIFNVADVLLCIGVPLLMVVWILVPQPEKK